MSYVSMGAVATAADLAVSLIALKSKAESAADSVVRNASFLNKSEAGDWRDQFVDTVATKIDACTKRDSTGKYNCERSPDLVKDVATVTRNALSQAEQKFDTSSTAAQPMRDLAAQIDTIHTELKAKAAASSAPSGKTSSGKASTSSSSGKTSTSGSYTAVSVSLDQIRAGSASLRLFQRASAVGQVQGMLNAKGKLGLDSRPLVVDDLFGPNTEFAVKAFQIDKALPASGVVDKATLDALEGRTAAGGGASTESDLPVGMIAAGVGALVVVGLLASRRGK